MATIGGAYERRRVLSAAVGGQHPGDAVLLEAALTAASRIGSDYDTSTFLQEALRAHGIEAVRAAFFTVVSTIGGAYERGRVLQAVVRKPGTSDDTLRPVLQSSRAMTGYELSQLLQLVARSHALNGDLRDAYVAAADRLGGYEQTQTLAALARSERSISGSRNGERLTLQHKGHKETQSSPSCLVVFVFFVAFVAGASPRRVSRAHYFFVTSLKPAGIARSAVSTDFEISRYW